MQNISAKKTRTLRRMIWIAATVFACILLIAKWLTGSDIASAARERKKAGLEIRSDALIARCNEALADDGVEILADGYWRLPGPPFDLFIRHMTVSTQEKEEITFSLTAFSRIWPPQQANLPVNKVIVGCLVPDNEKSGEIPASFDALLNTLYDIYAPALATKYPEERSALFDMQMQWLAIDEFDGDFTCRFSTPEGYHTKINFVSTTVDRSGNLMKIMTIHTCTPSCRE